MEGKFFSPTRKQYNNKESLATDLFEWLNFEQSFFKTVFLKNSFLQNVLKNNLCKVSRRRARDRNRNPWRPRRVLRPSRRRLQKTCLETGLETETKSRDSITVTYTQCYHSTLASFPFDKNEKSLHFPTQSETKKGVCNYL